jgi:hypothetical protein
MALKDLLKKKDKTRGDDGSASSTTNTTTTAAKPAQTRRRAPDIPEFTFVRTTTSTQETIEPPSFPGDPERYRSPPLLSPRDARSGFGIFRRQSNVAGGRSAPTTPTTPTSPAGAAAAAGEGDRKSSGGSSRLHFGRTRSSASANVPGDLPDVGGDGVARTEDEEARWETRATVLVMNGALVQGSSAPSSPALGREPASPMSPTRPGMGRKPSVAAPAAADEVCYVERERLCMCVCGRGRGRGERGGLGCVGFHRAGLRLRRRISRRRSGCTKKAVSFLASCGEGDIWWFLAQVTNSLVCRSRGVDGAVWTAGGSQRGE